MNAAETTTKPTPPHFKTWAISALLLSATMINYMDRQTLSNLAPRIKSQLLDPAHAQELYGNLEFAFGIAFAIGSLVFGVLADRVSVRALYPCVLIAWSAVGVLTGLTEGYWSMLACRTLLGFFEAGHWPCALVVTRTTIHRDSRVLGNSILQSGASLGAIFTPLIIRMMVSVEETATDWRLPFIVIGIIGASWSIFWLAVVEPKDFPSRPQNERDENAASWWLSLLVNSRFWAMVLMVCSINLTWQLVRAWLPSFLEEGRGYSPKMTLYFTSVYYIATDVGCIAAGAAALFLVQAKWRIHHARLLVYTLCALLTSLTMVAAQLPKGWALLGVLLLVAAGSLGLFPCYYSFTQEVTTKNNVGKVTGILSCLGWLLSSPMQKVFGRFVDTTKSFDGGLMLVGLAPLIGLGAMLLLWRSRSSDELEH